MKIVELLGSIFEDVLVYLYPFNYIHPADQFLQARSPAIPHPIFILAFSDKFSDLGIESIQKDSLTVFAEDSQVKEGVCEFIFHLDISFQGNIRTVPLVDL